jgi:hypothetical protein
VALGPLDLDQSPRLPLAAYCHPTDHPRRPLSVAVLGVDLDNRAFSPHLLCLTCSSYSWHDFSIGFPDSAKFIDWMTTSTGAGS